MIRRTFFREGVINIHNTAPDDELVAWLARIEEALANLATTVTINNSADRVANRRQEVVDRGDYKRVSGTLNPLPGDLIVDALYLAAAGRWSYDVDRPCEAGDE